MASVAIVGPGSVGAFFAAHLAAAGHVVLSCARRPFTEFIVESPDAPVRIAADVATDPLDRRLDRLVDVVLLCVKAHQTAGAAPWLDRLCRPGVALVTVQNGLEGEERATPYARDAEVIAGVVYCGAELVAPGHVVHSSGRRLILPDVAPARAVVDAIGGSPARIVIADDYVTEAWRKLGANVVLNGTTGLTLRSMEVLRESGMARLAGELLRECWRVGRAAGAVLSDDDADQFAAGLAAMPDGGLTSMLQDRRAGRPTEHDAIYGSVVRAGIRHGVPTPFADTMLALLSAASVAKPA